MFVYQNRWGVFALSCGLTMLLSACGGGSSNSDSSISGTVIDGYIEGAKVCLDANNNGLCDDATETSA